MHLEINKRIKMICIIIYNQTDIVMNSNQQNSKKNNKENIEASDSRDTPTTTLSRIMSSKTVSNDDEARKLIIQFQYKMLQMYGPVLGIYAIPNIDNYNVWNCIIFVRKGFYKDGKFKFDLIFPIGFPHACPTIQFKSSLYHPLVMEYEGITDVETLLDQQWKYTNDNMLYNVFSKLQKMFVEKYYMEITTSHNPQAAKTLISKPHAFIQKALSSVQFSKENLYHNEPGTSLIINNYKKGELNPFKHKLEELCRQDKAPEQKRKQFLDFVLSE